MDLLAHYDEQLLAGLRLEWAAAETPKSTVSLVYFRAPLFEGQFLGLPWLPAFQPYAEAVLDAVAEALAEWAAQGWEPDQAKILRQLEAFKPGKPPLEWLDGVPVAKLLVTFTKK